nr:reverse transcriptase domain-containing protein [Tanacetum cinerariifolium]
MPNYEKFLKDLMSNKSKMEQISATFLNEECSVIIQNKLPPKLGDLESFLIPCTVSVTKENFDALLDESKPFSTTLEKISESSLDHEFKEFMAIEIKDIPKQEEEVDDNFEELPLEENIRTKNSIQDPLTDLVMISLPKHLEYAFLEKESLLLVVISALLKDDEKKRLVSVLKKHKEAFTWKTFDILGIIPYFCCRFYINHDPV